MSDKAAGNSSGAEAQDPLKRLTSIKPPRDLSLGAAKPKKVFTPNLNVRRNKHKGPDLRDLKEDGKGKREYKSDRNRNAKNGPNIIKSSGIFSEGLGPAEGHSSRSSYRRGDGGESSSGLQRPTIKVKDFSKIDKDLEEQRIRTTVGEEEDEELESEDFKHVLDVDAPVRLPMDDGGWTHSLTKVPLKIKEEVVVKKEPADDVDCTIPASAMGDTKPEVKDVYEDTNVAELLQSDKPVLIMLQLPDTLPGRGRSSEDESRRKHAGYNEPSTSSAAEGTQGTQPAPENKCRLADLEEGRIGKLRVHRSGRVSMVIGDTVFEVSSGTKPTFHQEVVSVAIDESTRTANLISLGSIQHKLIATPDWENMFSKMAM